MTEIIVETILLSAKQTIRENVGVRSAPCAAGGQIWRATTTVCRQCVSPEIRFTTIKYVIIIIIRIIAIIIAVIASIVITIYIIIIYSSLRSRRIKYNIMYKIKYTGMYSGSIHHQPVQEE